MDADRRMQRARWLPRPVSDAGDTLAGGAGRRERDGLPIAPVEVALRHEPRRRESPSVYVDVEQARRWEDDGLQAVAGRVLQRLADVVLDPAGGDVAEFREAELVVRREPRGIELEAVRGDIVEHRLEV